MKGLIFEDEKTVRNVLRRILQKEGIKAEDFESGKDAIEIIKKEKPDFIFLDIGLKDSNGLDILKQITILEESPYVIIISGHTEYKYLIEAMKLGAYDYITKPFDIERIKKVIEELKQCVKSKIISSVPEEEIIGKSPAMKEVFKMVGRAGATKEPVLLIGETGTGKEVIANLIHKYSNRADKPFIAINTAAIPSGLIESELFGYEKGAFTGADKSKEGKFLQANGGTLFLDEISEMPIEAQTKLLRAIQEMEITPLGSNKKYKIDVRIIAATNKDLVKLVAEGKFREDLFYRLSVIEIKIPPLRERKEDIPDLIELFTQKALAQYNLKKGGFTPESIRYLMDYPFPGNVRELKNIVFKLIALYRERPITPDLLPANLKGEEEQINDWKSLVVSEIRKMLNKRRKNIYIKLVEDLEEIIIREVLKYTEGNISEASKYLGIHRNTLSKKIKDFGL
ncbi:nitrogen fixation sigma-54 dependent transcriptional regulator GnfM [Venenivibrio stagnispumantis]|uniref:DNA-binding transcriptional regulator NtrC n=1 Tax=Venenivibrio stagnispumantis TaxID=407998 RepID=A0AA45WKL4_9AQUI|nr:sigma-54 dependent transcriptional regulator [Venenivibrio stagnispumantis]SMP08206.1 two-component system, NtrC family, nitrogen regulation response regulator GlnG/two-component system, NtrC family, response regulator AtoC [Venenivibrio stagnispumantis]